MKRIHFKWYAVSVVCVIGIFCVVYIYNAQGVVSESTIARLRAKCSRYVGIKNVSCLRHELELVTRATNLDDIMHAVLLDSYHADDSNTLYNSPNCHALAHLVGETAGRQSLTSVPRMFAMCGTGCVYGCVHGMFSGLLKRGKLEPAKISTICDVDIKLSASSNDHEECVHGIGHGLADYFHNDVPQAVHFCNNFMRLDDKQICWDGVFMEVYEPVVSEQSSNLKSTGDFADCDQYQRESRVICIQSILSVRYRAIREINQALETCQRPLVQFEQCMDSVDAYQSLDLKSEQSIKDRCEAASSAMQTCANDTIQFLVKEKDLDEQVNGICQKNGVVLQEQCRIYVKKQLESRAVYN